MPPRSPWRCWPWWSLSCLFAVPTGFAWRFANRARARGDDRARVPAIVLTTLVAAFIGQGGIAWLAAMLAG